MEFYQQILLNALCTMAPDFDAQEIVESSCYQTLQRIRAVLYDDTLDDAACFQRIEAIVRAFEAVGSDGGNRHDFG